MMIAAMMPITARPPTTPPTMAPTFVPPPPPPPLLVLVLLELEDVDVDVLDDEDDVEEEELVLSRFVTVEMKRAPPVYPEKVVATDTLLGAAPQK
jgi:hypothetical protein